MELAEVYSGPDSFRSASTIQIMPPVRDNYAAGIEGFGQSAHFVALIEDGLLRGVRPWNLVLGVVSVPEQLPALAAPQEFRLGNVRLPPRGGGGQNGASHDGLCDARCAEIEQEDVAKLVAAPVDDIELVAQDFD